MSSPARRELDELGRRLLARARAGLPRTVRGRGLASSRPIGLNERLAGGLGEPERESAGSAPAERLAGGPREPGRESAGSAPAERLADGLREPERESGNGAPAERLAGLLSDPARRAGKGAPAEPTGPGAHLLALLGAVSQTPAGPELVLASRRRAAPLPPPAIEPAAPIPAALRAQLEPILGEGLEDVRLHAGAAAQAMAARFGAAAFAHGRDVFFARDRLQLGTPEGRALLAHEAMHTRQRALDGSGSPSPEGEAAAEAAERRVLARERPGRGAVLAVDHLVRNYSPEADPLTAREVARLDGLSARALAVCERLLAESSSSMASVDLSTLSVDVTLNLDIVSDQELAETWGRALAHEIERHVPPATSGHSA